MPSVAFAPASLALRGEMTRTPPPEEVNPVVAPAGVAGRAGSMVPQMSRASAACQVVFVVGCTAGALLL